MKKMLFVLVMGLTSATVAQAADNDKGADVTKVGTVLESIRPTKPVRI